MNLIPADAMDFIGWIVAAITIVHLVVAVGRLCGNEECEREG